MIKLQKEFPLMAQYKEVFAVTPQTIFAYGSHIYTNYSLPPHQLIHENQHLKQQDEAGLDEWVKNYLTDTNFRLKMELDAFRVELASIKDRNKRHEIRLEAARNLSGTLYGNIISTSEALKLLMH